MTAYYNEIDPYAAQWLRNLISAGHIPPGDVDERSIADVSPDDLEGYVQCHFFAGVGVWPYALRLAGWPDDQPVWTGSCPCQPFSTAGKGKGIVDERHLWPAFRWLISQCAPEFIFGEQVASPAGRGWLAGVRTDLEILGYAVGASDLCAAGVGAPHIRQRLWWVAHGAQPGLEGQSGDGYGSREPGREQKDAPGSATQGSPIDFWDDAIGILCRDGKTRLIKPGLEPLVDGAAFRVGSGSPLQGKSRSGLLRAYGNAIVPQVARVFIESVMDVLERDLTITREVSHANND